MSDSIPEDEELFEEGHALVTHGLTHLRKALDNEPVELFALVAWHHSVQEWIRLVRRPGWPLDDHLADVMKNLMFLGLRLPGLAPDSKPYDFVVDTTNNTRKQR